MRMVKRMVDLFLWLLLLSFGACFLISGLAPVLDARVCMPLRELMTGITGAVYAPIFELLVVCVPVVLIIMLVCGKLTGVTTVAKLLLISYVITLGIPSKQPIRVESREEPTIEEYITVARLISDKISELPEPDGYELSSAATAAVEYAHKKLNAKETDIPKVKNTVVPTMLAKMGIVAYFAFATAEVVVNTSAPGFMSVLATAHEVMHFLGITREDEANLFATVALIESGDPTLALSAYLSAFVYVGARICDEKRDTYSEIYAHLPAFAREMLEFRAHFLKEKGGTLATVSDTLNDYAVSLHDPRGAESYSETAALLVPYFLE